MSKSPERINPSSEKGFDSDRLGEIGAEHRERLRENLEKSGEKSKENIDEARHEALERASSVEKEQVRDVEQDRSPEQKRGPITKTEREASFNATLQEIRTHMSPTGRTFSKLIHNKAVEKVSDIAGNTVVRPNAVLAGAASAFLLTLAVYLVAKNLGYPLSGFETIGAFMLGWVLGIAYDFVKAMATGKK